MLCLFHVQSIAKFHDEAEVIQKANNSEYGLSAAVFTKNLERAHRVADSLESGQVTINAWAMLAPNMPFGGMLSSQRGSSNFFSKAIMLGTVLIFNTTGHKQSGFGRDGGLEALEDWTTVKAIKVVLPRL